MAIIYALKRWKVEGGKRYGPSSAFYVSVNPRKTELHWTAPHSRSWAEFDERYGVGKLSGRRVHRAIIRCNARGKRCSKNGRSMVKCSSTSSKFEFLDGNRRSSARAFRIATEPYLVFESCGSQMGPNIARGTESGLPTFSKVEFLGRNRRSSSRPYRITAELCFVFESCGCNINVYGLFREQPSSAGCAHPPGTIITPYSGPRPRALQSDNQDYYPPRPSALVTQPRPPWGKETKPDGDDSRHRPRQRWVVLTCLTPPS